MAGPALDVQTRRQEGIVLFVRSWGTFRTLSVALMMFVHGRTKADVLGTSSERRDCQRNISASPATTWKLGSLTVWEGKAAATAATATPAARIACYEPPGQKNRLWLNKAANRNEFNFIVFPLAPIFAIRWWSCR